MKGLVFTEFIDLVDEKFSLDLARRVFFSAPVPGKFQPKPQSS